MHIWPLNVPFEGYVIDFLNMIRIALSLTV